jgi:hypothetical protein
MDGPATRTAACERCIKMSERVCRWCREGLRKASAPLCNSPRGKAKGMVRAEHC